MDVKTAKIICMVLLGGISLILGYLPIKIGAYFQRDDRGWKRTVTSVLLCFGGGVLFATSMIHMLPEVSILFTNNIYWLYSCILTYIYITLFLEIGWRKSGGFWHWLEGGSSGTNTFMLWIFLDLLSRRVGTFLPGFRCPWTSWRDH